MTDAYRVGSLARDAETDLKMMSAAASAANYDCFETDADVNYQVPADHEFIVTHIILASATGAFRVDFYSGDDAKDNDAAAPTNAVRRTGTFYFAAANVLYPVDVLIRIPAGKYPHLHTLGNDATVNLLGYERSTA